MKTRFAFTGFRHSHILDLLAGVEEHPQTELVACCEEDAETRADLAAKGRVHITHEDHDAMLREVPCDVVAIGDTYGRRGALVLAALKAGKHILSDKPLCTSLAELDAIEATATERNLLIGLQLDSRGYGAMRTLREIILSGRIGALCSLHIGGQHPLLLGRRPAWYFVPGQHGGTINDIGVHAFDFVPWMTGLSWDGIPFARSWNAKASEFPHFEDCAQLMGTLDNGAGVLADFSYLAPDTLGYQLPFYWRILAHGTRGQAQTHLLGTDVELITDSATEPERVLVLPHTPRAYLNDFLIEIFGHPPQDGLRSVDALRATRLALQTQARASR